MSTVFVLRCDGRREYIVEAMASAQHNLKANFDKLFIVNDSGDPSYASWLEESFPMCEFVHHAERQGMNSCVRSAFELAVSSGAEFAFSTEDDFIFPRRVNVKRMARLLHCERHLGQLVLKRQPWNDQEIAAGGQMEVDPERYTDHSCLTGDWVSHYGLWSGNPSLTRVSAMQAALDVWDNVTESDTYELPVGNAMAAEGYSVAFYGKRDDKPRCEHLGHVRSNGYRW